MKRFTTYGMIIVSGLLAGCSSNKTAFQPPPYGMTPQTLTAEQKRFLARRLSGAANQPPQPVLPSKQE